MDIYEKFAKIYINGIACTGCKYEPNASCEDRYSECAKRIKEVINESEVN